MSSMSRDAEQILKDALELPTEARAALADSLLDSLDTEVDDDAELAWRTEIERRLKEVESGRAQLTPWSEVRARLWAAHKDVR
jgi:putative addiction module component (TIGR02574 family)